MTRTAYIQSTEISRKRLRSDDSEAEAVKESLPNLSEDGSPSSVPNHVAGWKFDTRVPDFLDQHSDVLKKLYSQSVEGKLWIIAAKGLARPSPPVLFPEYTKPGGVEYVYRELDFWTSGFFPGSLHALLERRRKYRHLTSPSFGATENVHELQLEFACKYWTENLHQNALLGTTHDLGFMIMPWAKLAYELNHDLRALQTIKTTADTLFSRFNSNMGCIRSWDKCVTKKYNFYDLDTDYMVIIDNMMNLDLLFYAAARTSNVEMHQAAVEHARTTAKTHVRPDGSTTHLIVLDPQTGNVKHRLTNQGYSHTSCWARGQSWGIAGFAETFLWTREPEFLETARKCADYFLDRLPESGIVPWDFDALEVEGAPQPPDTSAAMIASYGMLLIHQALNSLGQSSHYLMEALRIIRAVCTGHVNPEAQFGVTRHVVETVEHGATEETSLSVEIGAGETILNGATINNYEFAPRRWANHGLVYADYYFLLVGNKLLEMGIGSHVLKECRAGL
ncbi:glycoside hydrolase family 88 protein [Corynespora cassiicola Philippines]|uniref:Glycoside hydrolase family 88 protein n=1 Tax=Corynespora cassiicola Philippines TaxID=1448308 RepID=A0A2T2N7H5_CORCC|nr:glycoside hydrolase family 88 protein [Corynespora cassiicola Philippines]